MYNNQNFKVRDRVCVHHPFGIIERGTITKVDPTSGYSVKWDTGLTEKWGWRILSREEDN